ncbi:hypothetical protein MAPG_07342 [Magnaporthiopsis poae ATCC 64411]|uniref:Uncharacterized protein n=1 Tax=Magnaporthiopsis poae (strain ATCC 64411 / 73-15) TaxID=644358 RepID=A0A0C4E4E9_MAGP6|nr:hypothetical protein MAPG_07342 [Magnaporthiopsis poae ATCC 64411]
MAFSLGSLPQQIRGHGRAIVATVSSPDPPPNAGSSRPVCRELTRAPQQPPSSSSPPPQPKSAFPATRRDWRPSGDGGSSRR